MVVDDVLLDGLVSTAHEQIVPSASHLWKRSQPSHCLVDQAIVRKRLFISPPAFAMDEDVRFVRFGPAGKLDDTATG
jgi:hypothetical protein